MTRRMAVVVGAAAGAALMVGTLARSSPPPTDAQGPGSTIGLELVGEIGGLTTAVAADAEYAYVALGRRLLVLSYSASAPLRLVGASAPFASEPRAIVLGAGLAYVVDPSAGIHVVETTNRESPVHLRTLRLSGDAMAMVVSGSHGYVAAGAAGLVVLDLADPARPSVVGSIATPRLSRSVALAGEHALVAERDAWVSGLRVVDVSDPTAPKDTGFVVTPGGADHVALVGTSAFVLGASGTLWVIDVADPRRPARIGKAELEENQSRIPGYSAGGSFAYGLAAVDDFLYVAQGERGLRVVDARFAPRPLPLAPFDTPGEARGVVVRGRRPLALVADGSGGLRVIDVRTPASPAELYAYDEGPGAVRDVAAGNGFLCAVSQSGGTTTNQTTIADVGDLSDPASPRLAGSLSMPGAAQSVRAGASDRSASICAIAQRPVATMEGVGNRRRYVYMGGIRIVDAASRSSPTVVSEADGPYLSSLAFGENVLYGAWNQYTYRDSGRLSQQPFVSGLVVYDFRRLHSLNELARLALPGEARDVAAAGLHAFVAAGSAGLHAVLVNEKERPRLRSTLPVAGLVRSIALTGTTALLATEQGGLVTVDVSDPGQLRELAAIPVLGGGRKVDVSGDYAILSDGEAGVHLFDVSDPSRPRWLDRYAVPLEHVNAVSASIRGDHVYVGVDPATLLILRLVEKPWPTPSTTPPTARPSPTEEPTATPTPTGAETPSPSDTPTPSETPEGTPTGRELCLPRLERSDGR